MKRLDEINLGGYLDMHNKHDNPDISSLNFTIRENIMRNYLFSAAKLILLFFVLTGYGHADNLYVWYGNSDGSPIIAEIGELVDINIFAQTDSSTWIADMHLALGADNNCFDSLLSEQYGEIYYPLTVWDGVEFLPPDGSPPNPEGWSNQSLLAFAELSPPYESNWLHNDQPTLTSKMVFKAANDPSLLGQTIACLRSGINDPIGLSFASDTLMQVDVMEYYSPVYFTGEVEIGEYELPEYDRLLSNYPNPFNAQTTVEYTLPEQTHVRLDIYDIKGRLVENLVDFVQPAGHYSVIWGVNNTPSGIYFYRIATDDFSQTRKMVLLK